MSNRKYSNRIHAARLQSMIARGGGIVSGGYCPASYRMEIDKEPFENWAEDGPPPCKICTDFVSVSNWNCPCIELNRIEATKRTVEALTKFYKKES